MLGFVAANSQTFPIGGLSKLLIAFRNDDGFYIEATCLVLGLPISSSIKLGRDVNRSLILIKAWF